MDKSHIVYQWCMWLPLSKARGRTKMHTIAANSTIALTWVDLSMLKKWYRWAKTKLETTSTIEKKANHVIGLHEQCIWYMERECFMKSNSCIQENMSELIKTTATNARESVRKDEGVARRPITKRNAMSNTTLWKSSRKKYRKL